MEIDRIDQKIIQHLRGVESSNIGELAVVAFAREAHSTFKRRLHKLEAQGIITISKSEKVYEGYDIRLTKRFKKYKNINI